MFADIAFEMAIEMFSSDKLKAIDNKPQTRTKEVERNDQV